MEQLVHLLNYESLNKQFKVILWPSNQSQHANTGAVTSSGGFYGEGNGTIHFDFVLCSGREYSLTDCNVHTKLEDSTAGHEHDIGVKCEPGM